MIGAWLAVVVFLLGVMVGRDVSIIEMITGQESADAAGGSFAAAEQPFVASTTRREPSMAATDGDGLSYFRRLDDDMGPELDAGLLEDPARVAGTVAPIGPGGVASGYRPRLPTGSPTATRSRSRRCARAMLPRGWPRGSWKRGTRRSSFRRPPACRSRCSG